MRTRFALSAAIAASTLAAVPAAAQFAGVVPPPPPPPSAAESAAAPALSPAQRDSSNRRAMTDMKAWVDSAAGVSMPAPGTDTLTAVGDSAAAAALPGPGRVRPAAPPATQDESFRDGARAPDTATALPLAAAAGALLLGVGLFAGRRRDGGA